MTGAILGLVVLAIVILALVFQWNWLRGPISSWASGRLHRQVRIAGDLSVHPWSWTPTATATDITVAEPAWAGKGSMARLPSLTIGIDLKSLLLRGKLVLPVVDAEHPDVILLRDRAGRTNWSFGRATPQPLKLPPIRHFTIDAGRIRFDDARRRLSFSGVVSSNERLIGWGRGRFTLVGRGVLNRAPFSARIVGGPLVDIDPNRPYPFTAAITAGATHLFAAGALARPFDLSRVQASLHVGGPDMSDLYGLTGLALPDTPPYDVALHVARNGTRYDLTRIRGRTGTSDLSGHLTLRDVGGRRDLTGALASRRLNLADLTAVIGGAPKGVIRGTIASPGQKAQAAMLSARHEVFPTSRLEVSRLRGMDADVSYRAASVAAGPLPIRQVILHVRLDHSLLAVDPLAMVLPQGALSGWVRIDARGARPAEALDLSLAHARIEDLLPKPKGAAPLRGELEAGARLSSVGDSVRAAAANARGVVALAIPHGQMRQLLAELMGIDVAKSLFLYLSKDEKPTPVRCAVAEFQARAGVLNARRLLIDTGVVQAQGKGYVNLRSQRMDLTIAGKPKKFRLIRLAAPITIKGPLSSPKFGVEIGKAAGQLGIGAVLGAVVSPLAAILPLVAPGGAKNADCGALLAEAAAHGAPLAAHRQ
ncbi:MAG TPA: AsmA family protein [Caulobacteraceae bacterium]|nr:AsmA family protein [Caulobacteraceae bacterium]